MPYVAWLPKVAEGDENIDPHIGADWYDTPPELPPTYSVGLKLKFRESADYDEKYLVAKKVEQFLRDHVEGIYVSHPK